MLLTAGRGLALVTALFFTWLALVDLPPGGYAFAILLPIAGALIALRWPIAGGVLFLLAAAQHAVVQYTNAVALDPDAGPASALLNGIILLVLPTLVPGALLVVAGLARRRADATAV